MHLHQRLGRIWRVHGVYMRNFTPNFHEGLSQSSHEVRHTIHMSGRAVTAMQAISSYRVPQTRTNTVKAPLYLWMLGDKET